MRLEVVIDLRVKKIVALFMSMIFIALSVPISVSAEDTGTEPEQSGNRLSAYNNFYASNKYKSHDMYLYSLNNLDTRSLWRPKYEDIDTPIKEYIALNDKDIKVTTNAFDVDWSEIDKSSIPTSRALEILGYDFLMYRESVNDASGSVARQAGFDRPITAPYFLMNIYKALGIELYDIYFKEKYDDSKEVGVYVSRTNPDSYWKLFMNDHPIDYDVYNSNDVMDTSIGGVLTTADAISILAQMLDFYGEPIISKQEEYLLLQVYGKDVPTSLSEDHRLAWSYLKCRGIIGEEELDYSSPLNFDDMMNLLMRAKDVGSRTNFKEIQITTNLDDSFIRNGFYEDTVNIRNQVTVTPEEVKIDWTSSNRIDFLFEIDNKVAFKFESTGELNRSLFISSGPYHSDTPIKGSVYHGIVDNRFYHFSAPRSEVQGLGVMYVNSSKSEDRPPNYMVSSPVGGVYSKYTLNAEGCPQWAAPSTFNKELPDSMFVDFDRLSGNTSSDKVHGAPYMDVEYTYSTELLDVEKSIANLEAVGAKVTKKTVNGKEMLVIKISSNIGINGGTGQSSYGIYNSALVRFLVIKDDYQYNVLSTTAILGLTGTNLLIPIESAKSLGVIRDYKEIQSEGVVKIYTYDEDIVIVDNKNKIIQKGNSYLQLYEDQPLYAQSEGQLFVDFRALYGSKEARFIMGTHPASGERTVTLFSNMLDKNTAAKIGDYTYLPVYQRSPYNSSNSSMDLVDVSTDLLLKLAPKLSSSVEADIQEILMPFSTLNPLGNYILYGEAKSGVELYYLVSITPKGIAKSVKTELDYTSIFKYVPSTDIKENYDVSIIELKSTTDMEAKGIKNVPGVGWCYSLDKIKSTPDARKKFLSDYRDGKELIPFAVDFRENKPQLVNFNINFFDEGSSKNLVVPKTINKPIPAAVGLQAWFTNPNLIQSISYETIEQRRLQNTKPFLYWGSMFMEYSEASKSLVTVDGKLDIQKAYAKDDVLISSMNWQKDFRDIDTFTGAYMITSKDYETTISEAKEALQDKDMDRSAIRIEEFFKQFEKITFMDFVRGLDNIMSILYYIATRVVPLIILCLLIIILMISMMSDMRIVQTFCTKVFDPVKFLTFGTHNIQTVQNKFLIFSLIGALTIMGFIQAGNLEKIIIIVVRFFYAAVEFFK